MKILLVEYYELLYRHLPAREMPIIFIVLSLFEFLMFRKEDMQNNKSSAMQVHVECYTTKEIIREKIKQLYAYKVVKKIETISGYI